MEAVNSLARSRCGEGNRTPGAALIGASRTNVEVIGCLELEAVEYQMHGGVLQESILLKCRRIESRSREDIAEVVVLLFHILIPRNLHLIYIDESNSKVLNRHTVSIRSDGIHRPRADAIIMSASIAVSAYVDIMLGLRSEVGENQRERIDTRILRSNNSRVCQLLRRNEDIVISYVIADRSSPTYACFGNTQSIELSLNRFYSRTSLHRNRIGEASIRTSLGVTTR